MYFFIIFFLQQPRKGSLTGSVWVASQDVNKELMDEGSVWFAAGGPRVVPTLSPNNKLRGGPISGPLLGLGTPNTKLEFQGHIYLGVQGSCPHSHQIINSGADLFQVLS